MYSIQSFLSNKNLKKTALLLQPEKEYRDTDIAIESANIFKKLEEFSNILNQIATYESDCCLLAQVQHGEIVLASDEIERLAQSLTQRQKLAKTAKQLRTELETDIISHKQKVDEASKLVELNENIENVISNKNENKADIVKTYNVMRSYSRTNQDRFREIQISYYNSANRGL